MNTNTSFGCWHEMARMHRAHNMNTCACCALRLGQETGRCYARPSHGRTWEGARSRLFSAARPGEGFAYFMG